jgi:hypothetical protein
MSTTSPVSIGVAWSAACLGASGVALLFAPVEVARAVGAGAGGPLVQLLGAALLGFAAMNWVARGSALGGIYGRAVVAGNQTHLTIGALLLVKAGVEAGARQPAYWALTGLYVGGAAFFTYLMFFSTGSRAR